MSSLSYYILIYYDHISVSEIQVMYDSIIVSQKDCKIILIHFIVSMNIMNSILVISIPYE